MSLTPSEVRIVIVGVMLAMFLAALDQTIVAIALPPIARDLGDFALISWVITAYLLTSTCVTPIVGKLSDLYGRRRLLAACLIVFMAGSAYCALAPSMLALILARALQGLGGGGLITLAQTIVADVVSPRERGRYAGYFAGVWAAAALLGPTIGGILTQYYGWSWIFWINLPFGLAALLIADRALRKLPIDHHRSPIDYASIALLSGATVAFLLVLSLGGNRFAWTSREILGLAVLAVVLGGAFMRAQRRSAEPILPPRFLGDRVIGPSLAAIFVVFGSYLEASAAHRPAGHRAGVGRGRAVRRSNVDLGRVDHADDRRLRHRTDLSLQHRRRAERGRAARPRRGKRCHRLCPCAWRRHLRRRRLGAGARTHRRRPAANRTPRRSRGSHSPNLAGG